MSRSAAQVREAGGNPGLHLKLQSDPADLAPARQAIERCCAESGFEASSCEEIGLVVNEALANVIRHAYGSAIDQPIELTVRFERDTVRIEIRDWGKGVNPLELPPKPAALDPLKPGGLGLVCMRRMMDSIVFIRQSDGMLLVMTRMKHRAQA